MKRVTLRNPPHCQKRALKDTIFSYGLIGVLAAAGSETASLLATNEGTNEALIETN